MTGYVRQSAADIVPTGVVRAAPINNELNALRDAFAANGGHKHDGTAAEGHPVPVIGDSDLLNKIATDTGNNRHGVFVEVGGVAVEQVRFQDGAIVPVTDNDVDLGTSSLEFKDLHIDGTANIDSLVADTADINGGTVDGAVIGGSSAAAGSFTTLAASGAITSTVSTGTAPLVIASTTKVSNLNVDQLDGADWAAPAAIGTSTPAAGTFTSLTANTSLVAATADINGGTLDGAVIGASSAQAITGTTVTATTGFVGGLTGNVTGNTTGTHTGGVIGNVTGDVTGNVTASTGTSSFNDVTINGTLNMNAGTSATITNLTSPTNSGDAATKGYVDTADALKLNLSGGTMSGAIAMGTNKITGLGTPTANADAATKVYVDTSISNLVASAPGLLDTLDELAAALGDDPNFATTVTNSIATKLPLAGGTMSGAIAMGTNKITGLGDPTLAQDAATKTYVDTADALKLNLSGGTMSGAIAMGTNKITGLGNPTANQDAATKTYVDTADALKLSLTGGTMSGAIAMGTSKITGLGDPTANQDAATKIYVDGILGSATSAAASAAAAATSASNAATSASNASTSASNAATSASSASTSATNAAASYDAFDDRYLGSKTSAPTLDNDGNALLTGALYWNSTSNELYLWTGSAWTRSALSGTDYVAKSGDTMTGALTATGFSGPLTGTVGATTPTTGAFTTLSASSSVTLSGGTANGVAYLNGSKVLTSGSALTFDGTTLSLTTAGTNALTINTPDYGYFDLKNGTSTLRLQNNNSIPRVATVGNYPLVFAINESEQMRLTSTGLGIGTSSPAAKLHVSGGASYITGASNGTAQLQFFNNAQTTSGFQVGQGYASNTDNIAYIFNTANAAMVFGTNNTERMRLDSSGNVGIGTSSPAVKLDVYSSAATVPQINVTNASVTNGAGITFGDSFSDAAIKTIPANSTTSLGFFVAGKTTERMRLDSAGNLGLGVTPSAWTANAKAIQIVNTSFSNDNYSGVARVAYNLYQDTNTTYKYIQSSLNAGRYDIGSNGVHAWYTAPSGTAGNAISFTQAMTLDASGRLGIGTTSPASALHVSGDTSLAGLLYLGASTVFQEQRLSVIGTTSGSTGLAFSQWTGAAYTERARISSGGAMMVGTTTGTERLTLASGAGVGAAVAFWGNGVGAGSELYVGQGGSNEAYFFNRANNFTAFGTNNTEKIRISAAGGFSVGTTADPGAGAIYATGAITAFYSDARLKTVSGKIENALDKVAKLSGVYYTNNDTAKSFGYTSDEVQVGVLAQEVEAVLPQIVKAAPFDLDENGNSKSGEHYKTVQYEKLVPLLIEAINELQAKVKLLENK